MTRRAVILCELVLLACAWCWAVSDDALMVARAALEKQEGIVHAENQWYLELDAARKH